MIDKDLLVGVRRALALHNTALQQRVGAGASNFEKLLPDKAVIKTEFHSSQEDMKDMINLFQASLDDYVKRVKVLSSERVKLPVSERSSKRQLSLIANNSHEVENIEYQLEEALAKERRYETITKSL